MNNSKILLFIIFSLIVTILLIYIYALENPKIMFSLFSVIILLLLVYIFIDRKIRITKIKKKIENEKIEKKKKIDNEKIEEKKKIEKFQIQKELQFKNKNFDGIDCYNLISNAYLTNSYDIAAIPHTPNEQLNTNSSKNFNNFFNTQNIYGNFASEDEFNKLTITLSEYKEILGKPPNSNPIPIKLSYCPDEFKIIKNKISNSILEAKNTETEYDCEQLFRNKGINKAIGYTYDGQTCSFIDRFGNDDIIDKENANTKLYGAGGGLQFTVSYWIYIANRPLDINEDSEYYEILICTPPNNNKFYFPKISISGNSTKIKLEVSCKDDKTDNESIFISFINESNLGTNKWHFITHTMNCKIIKHYVDMKWIKEDTLEYPVNYDILNQIDYNLEVKPGTKALPNDTVKIAQLKILPYYSSDITVQTLSYSYPTDIQVMKKICKKGVNQVPGEDNNFPLFCKPHRVNEKLDSILTPKNIRGSRVPIFYGPNEINAYQGSCTLNEEKCSIKETVDNFQNFNNTEEHFFNFCDKNYNKGISRDIQNPEYQYSRPIDVNIDNGIYYLHDYSQESSFRDPTVTIYAEKNKMTGKNDISGRVYLTGTIFINLKDSKKLDNKYKYEQPVYDEIGLFIGKIHQNDNSNILFHPSHSIYFQIGAKQGYRIEIRSNGEIYVNRPITDPIINLDGISWLPYRQVSIKNGISVLGDLRSDLNGKLLLLDKINDNSKINFFSTDRKCKFIRIKPGDFRRKYNQKKSLMFCEVEIFIKPEINTSSEGLKNNIAKGKKAIMSSIYGKNGIQDRRNYGPMIGVNGLVTTNIEKESIGRRAYEFGTTKCGSDTNVDPHPYGYDKDGVKATGLYESEIGSYIRTAENDLDPWWEVDLEGEYVIDKIIIFNKLDAGSHPNIDLQVPVTNDVPKNYYLNMNTLEGGKIILFDRMHDIIKEDIIIQNHNAKIDKFGGCNNAMEIDKAIQHDGGEFKKCVNWDSNIISASDSDNKKFKENIKALRNNIQKKIDLEMEITNTEDPKKISTLKNQIKNVNTDPINFGEDFKKELDISQSKNQNKIDIQDNIVSIPEPGNISPDSPKNGYEQVNRFVNKFPHKLLYGSKLEKNFCRYVEGHAGTNIDPWPHPPDGSKSDDKKRISCYYQDPEKPNKSFNLAGSDDSPGGLPSRGECLGPEYADPVAHESKIYFTRKYTINLGSDENLKKNGYSVKGSKGITTGWNNIETPLENSPFKPKQSFLYKYNNTVYLSGMIQYKSATAIYDKESKKNNDYIYPVPSVIGKLPEDCRPSNTIMCQVTNNVDYAKIEVKSSGHVIIKEASRKKYKNSNNIPFKNMKSSREHNLLCLDGVKFQVGNETKGMQICSGLLNPTSCILEPYKDNKNNDGMWNVLGDYLKTGNNLNSKKKPNLMHAEIFKYSYYNYNKKIDKIPGKDFGNLPKFRTSGDVTITFFIQIKPNTNYKDQVIIGKDDKNEGAVYLIGKIKNNKKKFYTIRYKCGNQDNFGPLKEITAESNIEIDVKYKYFVAIVRNITTRDIKIYIHNESISKNDSLTAPTIIPALREYTTSEHNLKIGASLDNGGPGHLSENVLLYNIFIYNKAMTNDDLEAARNLKHLVGRDYGLPKCYKDSQNGFIKLEGSFTYNSNSNVGEVNIRRNEGDIKNLTSEYPAIGSIITVLPEGFRPKKSIYFSVNDGFKSGNIEINENGRIRWWGYRLGYHNINTIVFEHEKDLDSYSKTVCLDGIEFFMLKEN